MPITSQKNAPGAEDQLQGRNTLARFYRCEAAAAQSVTPDEFEGLQDWEVGEPDASYSANIAHQGGGEEARLIERGYVWSGSLTFLKGQAWTQLAAMMGITLGTSDYAGIPMYKENDDPDVIFEGICRESDNTTHVGSVVIPDMILGHRAWTHPLNESMVVIPFRTRRYYFLLCAGAEMRYSVFTGDGSTTDQTLPAAAIDLLDSSSWRLAHMDNAYYVKEKASTASTGTIQTSGYSISTTTLTATTAPAAGTLVQCLYPIATA